VMNSPSSTPNRAMHLPENSSQKPNYTVGAPPPSARAAKSSASAAASAAPRCKPGQSSLRSASSSRERSGRCISPVAFGSSRPRDPWPCRQHVQQNGDKSLRPNSKDSLRRTACVGVADRAPLNASMPSRAVSAMAMRAEPRKKPDVKPAKPSSPSGAGGQQACHRSSPGHLPVKSTIPQTERLPSRRSFGVPSKTSSRAVHGPKLPASVSPTRRSPSQLGLPPPPTTAPPPVGLSVRDGTPRRRSLPSPQRDSARITAVASDATVPCPAGSSAPSAAKASPCTCRGESGRSLPSVPADSRTSLALLRGPAGEWKSQLPDDLRAKVVTKCPQGHELQTFATLSNSYPCSVCRKNLCCGSAMFGCRECNYDVCGDCFQRVTAILMSLSNGGRS